MTRLEQRCLALASWLLVISGTAYAVSKHLLPHDDPFSVSGSRWEPWALAAHVLAAPAFLFLLGLVFRRHVLEGLREGGPSRRPTGIATLVLVAALTLSGYLLQVTTGSGARTLLAYGHLGLGLAYAAGYVAHTRLAALRQPRDGAVPSRRTGARGDPLPGPARATREV